MPNWTERDLKIQYTRAKTNGWTAYFRDAGKDYDFDPILLMAVASRETNMMNIVGDNGHGYGIMQIDDRSFPEWCHSGAWKQVDQAIMKGATVLDGKRTDIVKNQGKRITFRGQSFIGKSNLSPAEILQIAVSSYNCGLWAYYNFSKGNDVDKNSTGRDYSADVMKRLAVFQSLPA